MRLQSQFFLLQASRLQASFHLCTVCWSSSDTCSVLPACGFKLLHVRHEAFLIRTLRRSDRKGLAMSGTAEKRSFTADWLHQNHELYTAATNHIFIASIRDGSIDVSNFKHWMEQDYHFVREFVRFVASVLLKVPRDAPEHDADIILGGLTALESEISWFRKEANFWQVFLEKVTPLEPNKEYCQFLKELEKDETPYAVAVAAFWLIELVYNASFMSCLEEDSKTPFELLSTVKRWGSPEFHQYTLSLKNLADKALEDASEVEQKQAQEVCVRILELEIKFWDMATIQTG